MISSFIEKFNEGGPAFTYPILILLFVIIGLFVKEVMKGNSNKKTRELIVSISWFAIAWGFLGRTFGLIVAFDSIAAYGELTPQLISDGLKMAILSPLLALFVFAVARVFVIYLVMISKQQAEQE